MSTEARNRVGNLVAAAVGVLVGFVVAGLLLATLWRAAQFAQWLGFGAAGMAGLVLGQAALLLLPLCAGYVELQHKRTGAESTWLFSGIVINAIGGIAAAAVQFRFLEPGAVDQVAAAILQGGLPGVAASAAAVAVAIAARRGRSM